MAESKLMWMKQNESRYLSPQKPGKYKRPSRGNARLRHLSVPQQKENSPQTTMDSFLGTKKSEIFDEEFSKADFQLLTARWKKKFLEEVPAN
ncbi:hypothetical protein NEF87_002543 [Candidatus Lokiarchaeum ossiferum]|uniref:Transposase n=1 Tax=Candidatus Lokiarchaeum ossiferum TaxID=2951803 RepID=A0ABY6HRW8_9ARCH|nr:hypothetical protein NEF87_002543 [Candidatus Lokiarchaeum sp. B-35]